jgi:hypothetical protein
MADDGDLEFDLDLEGEGDEAAEAPAAEARKGEESAEPELDEPDRLKKRLRDLQSRADREAARANKLEARLRELEAAAGGAGEASASAPDPEREALLAELREASLDAVYSEFEELRRYGIDRGFVTGRTRAEMRESAARLVGLIGSVATQARNEALREAGVRPEPGGGARQPKIDVSKLSDEEFEKLLAKVRLGM